MDGLGGRYRPGGQVDDAHGTPRVVGRAGHPGEVAGVGGGGAAHAPAVPGPPPCPGRPSACRCGRQALRPGDGRSRRSGSHAAPPSEASAVGVNRTARSMLSPAGRPPSRDDVTSARGARARDLSADACGSPRRAGARRRRCPAERRTSRLRGVPARSPPARARSWGQGIVVRQPVQAPSGGTGASVALGSTGRRRSGGRVGLRLVGPGAGAERSAAIATGTSRALRGRPHWEVFAQHTERRLPAFHPPPGTR